MNIFVHRGLQYNCHDQFIAYSCKNKTLAKNILAIAKASLGITTFRPQQTIPLKDESPMVPSGIAAVRFDPATFPLSPIYGQLDCVQFVKACIDTAQVTMNDWPKMMVQPANMTPIDLMAYLAESSLFHRSKKCINPKVTQADILKQKEVIKVHKYFKTTQLILPIPKPKPKSDTPDYAKLFAIMLLATAGIVAFYHLLNNGFVMALSTEGSRNKAPWLFGAEPNSERQHAEVDNPTTIESLLNNN